MSEWETPKAGHTYHGEDKESDGDGGAEEEGQGPQHTTEAAGPSNMRTEHGESDIVIHPQAAFWEGLEVCEARNARWYKRHLQYAVYHNCVMSLAQMGAMWMHHTVQLTRECADEVCMSVKASMPQPNIFPRSFHILKAIMGTDDASSYTFHVCKNECHAWEWLARSEWASKWDDKCPKCGTPRFKASTCGPQMGIEEAAALGRLEPQRVRLCTANATIVAVHCIALASECWASIPGCYSQHGVRHKMTWLSNMFIQLLCTAPTALGCLHCRRKTLQRSVVAAKKQSCSFDEVDNMLCWHRCTTTLA